MARADLAVQQIVRTGLDPAYSAAVADGHAVDNTDRPILHVKNGSAGAITVTVPTPASQDGQAIDDLAVSIPAGGEQLIGPFPGRTFAQPDGTVHVDYSAVTSVTAAALRI
jgi:hypothetical protein